MNIISLWVHRIAVRLFRYSQYFQLQQIIKELGHIESTADFRMPDVCPAPWKIFLYENTNIYAHAKFIISPEGENGKFIMMKNSGAAEGLTVITGNHHRKVGHWFKELMYSRVADEDKDVIVEEDVWIGANVTILSGVRIGRGATVGANSVCIRSVPPYAIVMGNPAVVVGFNYSPEEIIAHEETLYRCEERLPKTKIVNIFNKYN